MSALRVTPAEVHSLAGQLSRFLGELEHVGDIRLASANAAENVRLESAIDGFITRWINGLQDIRQTLASLSSRLAAAGVDYEDTERTLTSEFAA